MKEILTRYYCWISMTWEQTLLTSLYNIEAIQKPITWNSWRYTLDTLSSSQNTICCRALDICKRFPITNGTCSITKAIEWPVSPKVHWPFLETEPWTEHVESRLSCLTFRKLWWEVVSLASLMSSAMLASWQWLRPPVRS